MKPYDLEKLASPLAKLYMKIEDDLLTCIAQRLEKNLTITDTAKWELHMLAQMGSLNKDAAKIIAQRAREAPYILRAALETAAQEAIDSLEPACKEAVKKGYAENTKIPPSRRVQQAVQAYWKQAKRRQNLVNTVMRYKVKPAWIYLIKGIRGYIDKDVAKQPIYDILNKHTGAAIIGTETRQQAVRKAIEELLDKGIPAFVDRRGREWSPEAYINMDVRTTANNVAHQAQFDRLDDYDLDLVEVSSHSGARPKCFKDQGKLYSRKNKSGTVTDLHGRKIRYYPWNSSSYGEPDGILGINCGHHIYPFFPGMSTMRYKTTQSQAENDRIYKESQTQRALERKIRRDKQECNMYNALGDKEAFTRSSIHLKRHESDLKAFLDRTGRTLKKDREQVIGFGKSESGKAINANRKYQKAVDEIQGIRLEDGSSPTISIHSLIRSESRGVSSSDIADALTSYLQKGKIKTDSKGRKSIQYIGEKATVAINPDTGNIVTIWPTSTKKAEKLKKKGGPK